jgi:hypothetical protein
MKTILSILISLFFLNVSGQTITYLKVADKPEYANYLAYCNTPVPRTIHITAAITLLKVNDCYVQANTDWMAKIPLQIKFYQPGTKSATFEPNQKEVIAKIEIMVPRRYPASIDDFYRNWKTGNIQQGLTDSKTCGVWPALR